ncbi:hypothetical protein K435DRAFT_856052 [Dendrothele bispora CBS 962.96]|uniref:Uncharacterized protein n=1 Tax=Dendrothele bispora (strain CBS 962.96) TaxID=1314807 RepID=A0A4V4HGJ3_DENBC|nr:hypothetical protein K435DRAFT_856052 [Dendrothele bispora CBS 962.96]
MRMRLTRNREGEYRKQKGSDQGQLCWKSTWNKTNEEAPLIQPKSMIWVLLWILGREGNVELDDIQRNQLAQWLLLVKEVDETLARVIAFGVTPPKKRKSDVGNTEPDNTKKMRTRSASAKETAAKLPGKTTRRKANK